MCSFFAHISEQTAIISLCINCLFFVTEMGYVYCAVRNESLNKIQVNHSLHVSGFSTRRPGFDSRSFHVRFMVDKVALGQVFLRVLRFFPCQYHSTSAPYSSSSTCCSYRTDKQAKTGNLPKYNAASKKEKKRELWVEKYFHVVSEGLKRTFKNGVWTGLILFRIDQWLAVVIALIPLRVPYNILNFLTSWATVNFSVTIYSMNLFTVYEHTMQYSAR